MTDHDDATSDEDPVSVDEPNDDWSRDQDSAPARNGPDVDAHEKPLLQIRGLRTYFFTRDGTVQAVDGVDLEVRRGEVLGLVGESGCGKSVTSMSVLRLVGEPGRIVEGEVLFKGENLADKSAREMRDLRGDQISMIFQQPNASLNPVYSAGVQISEVFEIHEGLKRKLGVERAVEALRRVGIPDPEQRAGAYPHELSGGMAQRVMIAMALASGPELLIADEPTTALDVTIQAQILELMSELQAELGMAMLLITHDLGVVAETADRVAVMYAGQIVEQATTIDLFAEPKHPYTVGLLGSIPVAGARRDRLDVIPGQVPNLIEPDTGCRFASRCQARVDNQLEVCWTKLPDLVEVEPGHTVRCWLHQDIPQ